MSGSPPTGRQAKAARAAFLVVSVLLAGCSPAPKVEEPETFESALERMRSDAAFLAARADPELRVVEEIRDGEHVETRLVPCGIFEIRASGWNLLPTPDELARSGAVYSSPERIGDDAVALTIGAAESEADARYHFRRTDGEWMLTRVDVYSSVEPGAPLPPMPCAPPAATPD